MVGEDFTMEVVEGGDSTDSTVGSAAVGVISVSSIISREEGTGSVEGVEMPKESFHSWSEAEDVSIFRSSSVGSLASPSGSGTRVEELSCDLGGRKRKRKKGNDGKSVSRWLCLFEERNGKWRLL